MSFYRTLLAAVAAVAIASPVFADDTANAAQNPANDAAAPAQQIADNSSTQSATTGTEQTTPADTKVNVNKASAKDLMQVKGINSAKAKAIVAYRKKHGEFKSLDELKKVKGFSKIKSDSFKSIEDQLEIN